MKTKTKQELKKEYEERLKKIQASKRTKAKSGRKLNALESLRKETKERTEFLKKWELSKQGKKERKKDESQNEKSSEENKL